MGLLQMFGDPSGWDHMGGMATGGFGRLFTMLLVLLIGWIVWLGTRQSNQAGPSSQRRSLDVLDERYASGAIDRDEYLQRKRDLEQ